MTREWLPKLAFIGLICLVLTVPLYRITGLIAEREMRQQEAAAEVQSTWSGPQTVGGPILAVPYAKPVRGWRVGEGEPARPDAFERRDGVLYLLPESLVVTGELEPHVRHRGLFETVVYTARLTLRGRFEAPEPRRLPAGTETLRWQDAGLSLGLSELRGLRESPRLTFGGETPELDSAAGPGGLFGQAISARGLDVSALAAAGTIDFELTLVVNGSGSLSLLPLGRQTEMALASDWPDPSFRGAFLPDAHEVGPGGFTAEWSISRFARSFPQAWTADGELGEELARSVHASAFGTELLLPVDFYQLVSRCTKYALLFITLTFGVFLLFELISALRIHPVQYLMVGFALCLFYLMLLAAAEHFGFTAAYLGASVATVGLISGYSAAVLRTRSRAAILALALAALYAVLYVLVQLQTYALLVGSIGLFLMLALAMYLTRGVDGYALGARPSLRPG